MQVNELVFLSLATAALAVLVADSNVFERVRLRAQKYGVGLGCSFCLSFWIAALLAVLVCSGTVLETVITALAAVGGAAIVIANVSR